MVWRQDVQGHVTDPCFCVVYFSNISSNKTESFMKQVAHVIIILASILAKSADHPVSCRVWYFIYCPDFYVWICGNMLYVYAIFRLFGVCLHTCMYVKGCKIRRWWKFTPGVICHVAVDMAQDHKRIYCAVSLFSPHASFCGHHLFITCIALLKSDRLIMVNVLFDCTVF